MSKADDVEDLLGTAKTPAKKAAAKKVAAVEKKPAAKTAAAPAEKKTPAKKVAAVEAKPAKEPLRFAEGERQDLYDKVTGHFKKSKKPISSKDLAAKLEVPTRKLRVVLYALAQRAEPVVSLHLESSKVQGMTVSPA